MIKENIQININDKSFDAEIIAPSQVMTSTPQEETADITKSPNFILKVHDAEKTINVTDIVEVSFSLGDYDYTANMKAYNRGGGIIALQYDSNLTAEESSDSSEPEEVLPLEITFMGGDHQQINPIAEMLNDNFTVIDPNVIEPETGTAMDVTMMCEYSGINEDTQEPITDREIYGGSIDIRVPGHYTITATEPTTGHTGTTTLIVDAAPVAELILNADKYYTAYDISEKESPHNSVFVTATFNDVAIDAGSMAFDGLVYNAVDVKSGNSVRFKPNDVQIDGHPGVYTDDVTANYQGAQTHCNVIAVAVNTEAQTGLTVDKPYYACSVNQNTGKQTDARARILYNGTELDPLEVQVSGTYKDQHWAWIQTTGDFTAEGMETFHGYDIVTFTYNNETISCLLKIDIVGLETPEEHTLEFDSHNYDTSYDIYTGTKSQTRTNVLYDGASIHLTTDMFSGLVYNKMEPIASVGGIFKAKDIMPEVSAGQTYVDNVTVTYEGLTASCTVKLAVTDSAPE